MIKTRKIRKAEEWDAVLAAPFARLGVLGNELGLRHIEFLPREGELRSPRLNDSVVLRLEQTLQRYWQDPRTPLFTEWSCLLLEGTPFQRRVWQALLDIPLGETMTYGALARQLNSAPRAVGQACGANPLPIVIPCHRVVSSQGLGGFMGGRNNAELDYKRWLLTHETR
jgi:methylated-DNA-[protein]-cysteine S-methyltransferase